MPIKSKVPSFWNPNSKPISKPRIKFRPITIFSPRVPSGIVIPKKTRKSVPIFQPILLKKYPSRTSNVKNKDMNWQQAKTKYPNLNPFGDADRDGVANWMDCKPFNPKKQGRYHKNYNNPYKNKNIKTMPNLAMNEDTYKLRRKVIDLIYEGKTLGELPRIDVRITEKDRESNSTGTTAGRAKLNDNIIWIPKDTLKLPEDIQRQVVFHEIVHTVCGTGHDEKCPLMKSSVSPLSKEKTYTIFKGYLDKHQKEKESKYKSGEESIEPKVLPIEDIEISEEETEKIRDAESVEEPETLDEHYDIPESDTDTESSKESQKSYEI